MSVNLTSNLKQTEFPSSQRQCAIFDSIQFKYVQQFFVIISFLDLYDYGISVIFW